MRYRLEIFRWKGLVTKGSRCSHRSSWKPMEQEVGKRGLEIKGSGCSHGSIYKLMEGHRKRK